MREFFLDGGISDFPESLNRGRLSTVPPTGAFSASSYSYPQAEWHSGPVEVLPDGTVDLFGRTLTWSSDVLEDDVHVVGNAEVVIHLRSTEDDADVFVKLWDLQDTGYRKLVSRGWLRASHRELNAELSAPGRPFHDHRSEIPIPTDTFVELRIEVWPLAHCFQRGHRICLQVTNCDSPITDANYTHYYGLKVGTDEIGHSPGLESRLVLPICGEPSGSPHS